HTRFSRDWSSDVCSSDLTNPINAQNNDPQIPMTTSHYVVAGKDAAREANRRWWLGEVDEAEVSAQVALANLAVAQTWFLKRIAEIGRATCRERVERRVIR